MKHEKPVPCVMNVDGRTLLVLIPAKWVETDVTGEMLYTHEAMEFLDRIRALASEVPPEPTPGYIRALREALGLTQVQLARRLDVDKMTVARWEWGQRRPGKAARKNLEKLRIAAGRRGVEIKVDDAA